MEPLIRQLDKHAGRAEGMKRAGRVCGRLAERRKWWWTLACHTAIKWLLEGKLVTSDDVRGEMPPPGPHVSYNALGSALKTISEQGIGKVVGHVRTAQPTSHARCVPQWQLADRSKALNWLETHPLPPEPPRGDGRLPFVEFAEAAQ